MKVDLGKGTFYVNLPVALFDRLKDVCQKDKNLNLEFCAFLINQILTHDLHKDIGKTFDRWTYLHSKHLQKFNHRGYKYNEQLHLLEGHGMIDIRSHMNFENVRRPKGYRIKEKYLKQLNINNNTAPLELLKSGVQELQNEHIASIIKKQKMKYSVEAEYRTGHLTKWLRKEYFMIDKTAAIEYVYENYDGEHNTHKLQKRITWIQKFGEFDKYHRRGKDDRLHTYFTTLPKDLMPFIRNTYHEKKMVEVDIKNSQPFIFSVILEIIVNTYRNTEYIYKGDREKRIRDIIKKEINKKLNKENKYHININRKIKEVTNILLNAFGDTDFAEISAFIKSIRERDFYADLGTEMYLKGVIKKNESGKYQVVLFDKTKGYNLDHEFESLRDCAKRIVLNALYATGPATNKALKYFRDRFKAISKILDALKVGDPKDLPILMQQIEAKCVLDYCTKRIAKKYPDMVLITKHDSVSTTEDRAEELYESFEKALKEFFGITVRISKDYW